MPRHEELAQQGVEVEVDALGDRCAQQRGLQALKQPLPALPLQDLSMQSMSSDHAALPSLKGKGRGLVQ